MNTQKLEIPTNETLTSTDLQLLLAFYMRNGIDLTEWIRLKEFGYELIFSNFDFQETKPIMEAGITLNAQFDHNGKTIFIKYDIQR